MILEEEIREIIEEECDDYFFGVADLYHADNPIMKPEKPLLTEYPTAISIGITLPPVIPSKLFGCDEKSMEDISVNEMIQQLNLIIMRLSDLLKIEDYKSLPILVTGDVVDQRMFHTFSHELIANLAGLGQIGKDGLLITPEVGSRVLWGTVLTNAPLKVSMNE